MASGTLRTLWKGRLSVRSLLFGTYVVNHTPDRAGVTCQLRLLGSRWPELVEQISMSRQLAIVRRLTRSMSMFLEDSARSYPCESTWRGPVLLPTDRGSVSEQAPLRVNHEMKGWMDTPRREPPSHGEPSKAGSRAVPLPSLPHWHDSSVEQCEAL